MSFLTEGGGLAAIGLPMAKKGGEQRPATVAYGLELRNVSADTGTGLNKDTGAVEHVGKIPEVVHHQMVNVLANHFQQFLDIQRQNPTWFDTFMNKQEHEAEATLLRMVSDGKRIDTDKLGDILSESGVEDGQKTGVGTELALTVLENAMTRLAIAGGIGVVMRYDSGNPLRQDADSGQRRDLLPQYLEQDLGIGQGIVNKWSKTAAGRVILGGLGIGTTGAAIFGAAKAGGITHAVIAAGGSLLNRFGWGLAPLGMGATLGQGAAVGIGIAGIGVAFQESRRGYHIDQQAFRTGLEVMKTDPDECEFMYRAYGVDPRNFRVVGDKVESAVAGQQYRSGDMARVQSDLGEMVTLRLQMCEALGIRIEELDAMPDQAFYTRSGKDAILQDLERLPLDHARQVEVRFQEMMRTAGGPAALNEQELFSLRMQARREIMGRLTRERISEMMDPTKQEAHTKTVSAMKETQAALKYNKENPEASGRLAKAATEAHVRQKKNLESANDGLTPIVDKAKSYADARAQRNRILAQIQGQYGAALTSLELVNQEIARQEGLSLDQLRTLRESLNASELEMAEALNDKRADIDWTFGQMQANFDSLTQAIGGVNGIDPGELATASYDKLLIDINALYAGDLAAGRAPLRGWPTTLNNSEGARMHLYRARAEAQARAMSTLLTVKPELDRVIAFGINQNELLQMTPSKLVRDVAALGNAITLDDARKAIDQAVVGFKKRADACTKVSLEEEAWRESHNSQLTSLEASINTELNFYKDQGDLMQTTTDRLNEPRFVDEKSIALGITNEQGVKYRGSIDKVNAFVAATVGQTYDLSPTAIVGLTYQDILSRINDANAAGVAGAWGAAVNNTAENIQAAMIYLAEARALADPKVETPATELGQVLTLMGQPMQMEHVLVNENPDSLFVRLNRGNRAPVVSREAVNIAITEAASRAAIRAQKLAEVMVQSDGISPVIVVSGAPQIQKVRELFIAADPRKNEYWQLKSNLDAQSIKLQGMLALPGKATRGDVSAKIIGLQRDRDNLKSLGQLRGATTIQDDLASVDAKYKALHESRISTSRKIDPTGTGSIDVDSAAVTDIISRREAHPVDDLKGLRAKLIEEDNKLDQKSETVQALETAFQNGIQAYDRIVNRCLISEADLRNQTLERVLTRINGIAPPNGWPAAENETHIAEVTAAIAEARIRFDQAGRLIPLGGPINLDLVTGTDWQIVERDLLDLTEDQIMHRINEANIRGVPATWDVANNGDPGNVTIVQTAMQEARRRFELRVRSQGIQQSVDANNTQIRTVDQAIETAMGTLKHNQEFADTMVTIAERLDEKIFPWIREWAAPGGVARKNSVWMPVTGNNMQWTEAERFVAAGGAARNLPEGYFQLLHALTGYQDLEVGAREAKFRELVDHPEFNHVVIGQKLNDALGLGLDGLGGAMAGNINNVMIAIEQRLNGLPLPGHTPEPVVTEYALHKAIEKIIDDNIARVKVLH